MIEERGLMARPPELNDQSVTSVRVVYSDLHGVTRGKDVPIGEFDRAAEHGLAFCSAIMGTDLRHTPVVGGEDVRDLGSLVARLVLEELGGSLELDGETLRVRL